MVVPFPPGLTVRHPSMADAAAVTALVNAAETVHLGAPLHEVSDIVADWESDLIDLGNDVLLVEDHGSVVGWAQVEPGRGTADVHPAYCGRGIGGALLDWMEQRMMERTPAPEEARLGQPVPVADAAAAELLTSRGYERRWTSWALWLPPDQDLEPVALPEGVRIRPYRADEEHQVYRIIDDAFNEWEGRTSSPYEYWQAGTTARTDFDPAMLFVAEAKAELAGASVGFATAGVGWVHQLAVKRAFRNQGIGRALLAASFGEFRHRGIPRMGLSTDSRTGALDLYVRMGMVIGSEFIHWSRQLRPAVPDSV